MRVKTTPLWLQLTALLVFVNVRFIVGTSYVASPAVQTPQTTKHPVVARSRSDFQTMRIASTHGPTSKPTATTSTTSPTIMGDPTGVFLPFRALISPGASPAPQRPSITPSLVQTETGVPSPLPSRFPSKRPSTSLIPSPTPTSTARPTASKTPSFHPSSPPTRESSNSPSESPSDTPTVAGSATPTGTRSSNPTGSPTVISLTLNRAVIEMQLQNMMDLENTSSIQIWQDTTSDHIEKYWNSRPFPQIVVWEVSTQLLRQEIVITPPKQGRRLADEGTLTPLHNLYYQQNITGGYLRIDGRLTVDEDAIFVEPFKRDEADYTDTLAANLKMERGSDIQLIRTVVLEGGNMYPTVAPAVNTSTGSGGSLSTGTIVLIVIAAVIILTGGLGGYLYLRRRQYEHDKAWATENARRVDEEDEFALDDDDDDDYPVVVQSQESSNGEEGGEDDMNDEDTGPYSDPPENYLNQLPDDDDDDPRSPYTRNTKQGARSRGTLDDISDDESQDEIPNANPNQATSSCGSSVDDPPSLSAFQVTVTDLDD